MRRLRGRAGGGGLPAQREHREHARRDQCEDGAVADGRQPMNFGRLRLCVFMTANLVAATISSVLSFERGSSNASGGRRDAGEPPDPRGVARLDRVDREGRDQVRPPLDQRRLALVGRDGEVFERHRGTPEARRRSPSRRGSRSAPA